MRRLTRTPRFGFRLQSGKSRGGAGGGALQCAGRRQHLAGLAVRWVSIWAARDLRRPRVGGGVKKIRVLEKKEESCREYRGG